MTFLTFVQCPLFVNFYFSYLLFVLMISKKPVKKDVWEEFTVLKRNAKGQPLRVSCVQCVWTSEAHATRT